MQLSNTTPAYSRRPFTFSTLAGVCDVSVTNDDSKIVGRWCDELHWLIPRGDSSPAVDFANYIPRPESITAFTKKYGPLFVEPKTDGQFQFTVGEWLNVQEGFRLLWEVVASGVKHGSWGKLGAHDDLETVVRFDDSGEAEVIPGRGDRHAYVGGKLVCRTGTMLRFLVLDLLSRDRKRLRKCKRPSCFHPYFVARHLNQSFCSDRCAAWGQSEWKRLWWKQRGKQWRAEQRSKVKSRRRR